MWGNVKKSVGVTKHGKLTTSESGRISGSLLKYCFRPCGAYMHPLDDLLKWLPDVDFAVLEHRFASHGRDYVLFIEALNQGQHEIAFSHCVRANARLESGMTYGQNHGAMNLLTTSDGPVQRSPRAMSGEQTGRLLIQEFGPSEIHLRPLNGRRDSAGKCLRRRWKLTVSFCG